MTPLKLKERDKVSYYAMPGMKSRYIFKSATMGDVAIENIERVVLEYFSLRPEDFLNQSRERHYLYPRQLVMFLLRKHTLMSLKAIARRYKKDHTTVINSVRQIFNLSETIDDIREDVNSLEKMILA